MKRHITHNFILLLIFLMLFTSKQKYSQENPPRLSPKASVSQTIGYTDVTVDYGRPGVKGRKIWGGLVPYNEVWRTGANEATAISFSTDVMLDGNKVPAGRYALFTIPTGEEWVVILNKVDDQWGAFKYDKKEDLIRFKVIPIQNTFIERLRYCFGNIKPYSADLVFEWEYLKFTIAINTKIE